MSFKIRIGLIGTFSENQKRLHETFQALEKELALVGVPVYPAKGAIFAWTDWSHHLLEGQTEKELWFEIINDAKVLMTTGYSCNEDKPGMFRIVYAWPASGVEAMEELGRRLVKWKKNRLA